MSKFQLSAIALLISATLIIPATCLAQCIGRVESNTWRVLSDESEIRTIVFNIDPQRCKIAPGDALRIRKHLEIPTLSPWVGSTFFSPSNITTHQVEITFKIPVNRKPKADALTRPWLKWNKMINPTTYSDHVSGVGLLFGQYIEFFDRRLADIIQDLQVARNGTSYLLDASSIPSKAALLQAKSPILMVSGGLGVTPHMAFIRDWVRSGELAHRDVLFLYSYRNEEDELFREELEYIASQYPRFHLVPHRTTAPGRRLSREDIVFYLQRYDFSPQNIQMTVCGSQEFSKTVSQYGETVGISKDSIHSFSW